MEVPECYIDCEFVEEAVEQCEGMTLGYAKELARNRLNLLLGLALKHKDEKYVCQVRDQIGELENENMTLDLLKDIAFAGLMDEYYEDNG